MSESAKPRMAVIGLGSMGFGMATSLRRAGFEVTGWVKNLEDQRVEMVAEVETTMAGLVVLVMEAVVAVQVLELIVTEMAEREPMETPE